jgi:CubicO group peptidase (beta-lactamase class C family)
MNKKIEILQSILNKSVDNKNVFGTSFCIKHKSDLWCGASGNMNTDSPYFIASTTKLYVTTIILHLKSKGVLDLDDKISKYLEATVLKGLHTLNGKDYSTEISIKNLLAHISGIPDYFQQKNKEGKSFESELIRGNDQFWTFEQVVDYSKQLKPLFVPDAKGKAHYSDTNFQLLGKIAENITQKSITENYEELIFNPLELSRTYLYTDIQDQRPKTLYFKSKELFIPKAMASFGPDGGIVSTSNELMNFLTAFFNGTFFPKSYIESLKTWNRIFFPMQSGVGIHLFKLPWIFNPTGTIPELLGHSGLSGTLAYHSPEKDIYVAGTVNQVANPGTSFRLAIKLLQKVLSK